MQHQERADDTGRDGQADDQRRAAAAEEGQQHQDRQQAADVDVVGHQADGAVDVIRLVVNLGQHQAAFLEQPVVQPLVDDPQAGHDVQHVGADFALGVDGQAGRAVAAHEGFRLFVAQADFGHVADPHRRAVDDRQNLRFDLFRRAELAQRPDHVTAFPFPEVAGRRVLVLFPQDPPQVRDRQPAGRQPLGIDDHLAFRLFAAKHVGVRDALDALESRLDPVFRELPQFRDVHAVRHQRPKDGVLFRRPAEPQGGQTGVVRPQDRLQIGGRSGVCALEFTDLLGLGLASAEDEPGNRPIGGAGRADQRLVRVNRVFRHLLQAAVHLQQRLLHVRADLEFQRDGAGRVLAFGSHLRQALDALQELLLLADDLAFDFLRAGARPARGDGDRRDLHLRRQLHGHAQQRNDAEQRDDQHADRDFDRIVDKGLDESHRVFAGLDADVGAGGWAGVDFGLP